MVDFLKQQQCAQHCPTVAVFSFDVIVWGEMEDNRVRLWDLVDVAT